MQPAISRDIRDWSRKGVSDTPSIRLSRTSSTIHRTAKYCYTHVNVCILIFKNSSFPLIRYIERRKFANTPRIRRVVQPSPALINAITALCVTAVDSIGLIEAQCIELRIRRKRQNLVHEESSRSIFRSSGQRFWLLKKRNSQLTGCCGSLSGNKMWITFSVAAAKRGFSPLVLIYFSLSLSFFLTARAKWLNGFEIPALH